MAVKKSIVATALIAVSLFAVADAAAGHRRRVVARHRAWVGHRVVVHAPVVAAAVVIAGRPHGTLDLDVQPEETKVYVDGKLRGIVDDFDGVPGKLHLLPGSHKIRLETPEGDSWDQRVRVLAGHEINISLELDK